MRTRIRLAVFAVFVAANLYNALTKGGDFTVFLESGRRVLHAEPLYADSRVAEGVVGPPFQAVCFVPFAWLAERSEVASRVAWYALNLVLLVAGVLWWQRALADPIPAGSLLERLARPEVLLALLAVSHPLQANFQHQNLNVVLLALTGLAAASATRRQSGLVGVALGAAAALKAFPALLVVFLLARGRWKAVGWAVGTAAVLTALPVVWYGLDAGLRLPWEWLQLSASDGWPVRSHNQSLFAMVGRWLGPEGITATGRLTLREAPDVFAAWAVTAAALVAFCGVNLLRAADDRPRSLAEGMAVVLGLAVLLSPIAWDHYWVLFIPAFLLVLMLRDGHSESRLTPVYWTAAVMTSGVALLGREAWRLSRWLSVRCLAGVLLVVALSLALRRVPPRVRSPVPPRRGRI